MAKASLTRVERRDPHKLVHKMKVAELTQLAPNFDWVAYYREMQYPDFAILNVDAPEFIKELNTLLSSESIDNWKTYLRFHVADMSSPYLSSKFVEENFEFYRKYLRGAKETAAPLETLCAVRRLRPGRSAGPGLCGESLLARTRSRARSIWCGASKMPWASASARSTG